MVSMNIYKPTNITGKASPGLTPLALGRIGEASRAQQAALSACQAPGVESHYLAICIHIYIGYICIRIKHTIYI